MPTKKVDPEALAAPEATSRPAGPTFPDTVAYWLEDDLGRRISKLFKTSDAPLRLAGRALENIGALEGWTVARRDRRGARHVVASGAMLEILATPFKPERTEEEAAALAPFFEGLRRDPDFPSRTANAVTDERVY
jgi:hypothetical protein